MPRLLLSAAVAATLVTLVGCKTGFNKSHYGDGKGVTPPDCASGPSNAEATTNATNVFNLLAGLTCNEAKPDGVLMGQSAGFGDQIVDGDRSYKRLIADFKSGPLDLDHRPAIVAIDYEGEGEETFTEEELSAANEVLIQHWDAGGLVSISWTPLNPWFEADGSVGEPTDYSDSVDIENMLQEGLEYDNWRERLDAIAVALDELQDEGVVVLWRPFPAMNTDRFWWGIHATANSEDDTDASLYADLWLDMYNYFTEVKNLNNLLWVYSPAEGEALTFADGNVTSSGAPVEWAYPGDDYVDVVGAITYDDLLTIPDYKELYSLEKPFGMAEFGPLPLENGGQYSGGEELADRFDAQVYRDRLSSSYPFVAFWISGHSYDTPAGRSHQALVDNRYLKELVDNSYVITLERLVQRDIR